MFFFHEFLERAGLDPSRTRLLRHDARGLAAWRRGGASAFGCFASFQRRRNSPYAGVRVACQFVAGPTLPDGQATAHFLGTTRILDQWEWTGDRLPLLRDDEVIATEQGRRDVDAFDLEWAAEGAAFSERVLIRWGLAAAARSWSQWADRVPKEILELRLDRRDPPFPGFAAFIARVAALAALPQAWRAALGSVKGVYLLVADDGAQYVGSASGEDGFLGRWQAYAANGHGDNVLLRRRGHRDYTVSILEIAAPDMSLTDIIARETFWKAKLGARAHGLNAN